MSETPGTVSNSQAVHIIIHGYVQGVGFRYFTKYTAARLNVDGYVLNRYDGAVEIWAEGSRATLEEFINAVRRGPERASVDHLDLRWDAPKGIYYGFEVIY